MGVTTRRRVPDEEILKFFVDSRRPFQTAKDVAKEFDMERQSAHRRLQALHEEGRMKKEKVGAHAVVWWLPADDTGSRAPASPLEQLAGIASADEADAIEARSQEWREDFDVEVGGGNGS